MEHSVYLGKRMDLYLPGMTRTSTRTFSYQVRDQQQLLPSPEHLRGATETSKDTSPLRGIKVVFFFFLNFRDKANNSLCALSEKLMKFTSSEVGENSKQIILSFSLEYMECCHTEQTFLLSGTRHLTACADRSSPGKE